MKRTHILDGCAITFVAPLYLIWFGYSIGTAKQPLEYDDLLGIVRRHPPRDASPFMIAAIPSASRLNSASARLARIMTDRLSST